MKVILHQHEVVETDSGGKLYYAAGCKYEVPEDRAKAWIKAGAAEDPAGKVTRESLLTPEERAAEKKAAEEAEARRQAQLDQAKSSGDHRTIVYLSAQEQAAYDAKLKALQAQSSDAKPAPAERPKHTTAAEALRVAPLKSYPAPAKKESDR